MEKKIWLTSDTHFGHDRDFLYKPRGFKNIWDHDKTIIENWNNIIQPNDEVYHLGDVMLGNNEYGMVPVPFSTVTALKQLPDGSYTECNYEEMGVIVANSLTSPKSTSPAVFIIYACI